MLAIRPVTYEVETSLSPKRVLRKLDGDLIEHKPTINILSQSKFMKNHRDFLWLPHRRRKLSDLPPHR